MKPPKISLLLCTVRPDAAYLDHPDWHVIGHVIEDLALQTFKDFELVVVDGAYQRRRDAVENGARGVGFAVKHLPPPPGNYWVKHHKTAISTYRNAGIAEAAGELIVNLDDCCALPENFVQFYAEAYTQAGICVSATWAESGDTRLVQGQAARRAMPGEVFGFGSYPRAAAMQINGYDLAYDGSMYLEDADWSTRLGALGVAMGLVRIPGFRLLSQSRHDPEVIDAVAPLVKCCNQAWHVQRATRSVLIANHASLWPREKREALVAPCPLYREGDSACGHHHYRVKCGYYEERFYCERHPLVQDVMKMPLTIAQMRGEECRDRE